MGREIIDGRHLPDLADWKATVGTADVYSFRFKEPFGWAIFTVNNATGEFHVQSDWGVWQHRWNIGALGRSSERHEKPLAHFLGTSNDPSYVAGKFAYAKPRTWLNEFSEEKTKAAMRKRVLEGRLAHPDLDSDLADWLAAALFKEPDTSWNIHERQLGREEARTIWDQIDRWFDNYSFESEAAQLHATNEMRDIYPELYDFLTGREDNMINEEVWETFQFEPCWEYAFLVHKLLPFFFKYLRENVLCKEEPCKSAHTA